MADDIGTAATAQTAPQTPASLLADRYEVLGLLGAGGMGRVYRVRDRTLDEVVALKLLRRELADVPGMIERFRQEVKVARRVTHENVVRTFDLGQHGDDHFLTMEYVDGRSLAQRLDEGPLALDEAVRYARAVAAGLAAAHASAVLHRDLKPDNVLVGKTGRIAITDFGIARLAAGPQVTGEGFIGTPAYMAPEQVEGGSLGPAADVYAFGAILFEMLTGRAPWVGDDAVTVALARLQKAPPDPRQLRAVPDPLAELVLRCLARDPANRPADGGAVATALSAIHRVDATVPRPFLPSVPAKQSRAVAILPLRGSGELAEVADGLSEEIVDALSMTRSLRVRPLASVRAAAGEQPDARELGTRLGVDVVVEGSIRRRGTQIRIAARAIGVADGFQLWASHFDCGPDGLLAAGDEVVRAIARALVVDLDVPARAALDARIAERYLEAKARLRAGWVAGQVREVIDLLDGVLPDAPEDPGILATLAMALARSGFYDNDADLRRARTIADRALAAAPGSGEAQLASAMVALYVGDTAEAAGMLRRTVAIAPGIPMAQGTLGAVLLEAGALDDAISHLEAAISIDPTAHFRADLGRAYVYAGRLAEAAALAASAEEVEVFAQATLARYAMWRGQSFTITAEIPPELPSGMRSYMELTRALHKTRTLTDAQFNVALAGLQIKNPRLRAARAQFVAEFCMYGGRPDDALAVIASAVEGGLQDTLWMERCPLLAPLRGRPEFDALAAQVADRARAVIAAVHAVSV